MRSLSDRLSASNRSLRHQVTVLRAAYDNAMLELTAMRRELSARSKRQAYLEQRIHELVSAEHDR